MNSTNKLRSLKLILCLPFLMAVSGCEPKVDLGIEDNSDVASAIDADGADGDSDPVASNDTSDAGAPEKPPAKPVVRISDEAFRFAAHDGKTDVVRQSIDSGKDVNAKDPRTSHTALHLAAYNGHNEIVKLLLEHDAVVDCRDHEGKTPLIHACTGPFPKTVEILLEAGADINATESTEGFTPLMMAAGIGETDVVKVLLERGADATVKDSDQDTALSHAKNSRHAEIIALLEK